MGVRIMSLLFFVICLGLFFLTVECRNIVDSGKYSVKVRNGIKALLVILFPFDLLLALIRSLHRINLGGFISWLLAIVLTAFLVIALIRIILGVLDSGISYVEIVCGIIFWYIALLLLMPVVWSFLKALGDYKSILKEDDL